MSQHNDNYMAKQFSGLPLTALIGAPLKAAADANGMMAKSQIALLLDTCFEVADEKSAALKPIMISFDIERAVVNQDGSSAQDSVKMRVSLPLLTLIPINSLAVETLKVSFEMDVKSSTESRDHDDDEPTTEMHGSIAKTSKQDNNSKNSASARYEIELQAGQLPLPRGLTTIIDALTKNIAPIPVTDKAKEPS